MGDIAFAGLLIITPQSSEMLASGDIFLLGDCTQQPELLFLFLFLSVQWGGEMCILICQVSSAEHGQMECALQRAELYFSLDSHVN